MGRSGWLPERLRPSSRLAAECQAFLRGRLAERLDRGAWEVPRWMWTNLLAHGTERQLRAAARATYMPNEPGRAWWEVRSFLAAEVLEEARRHGSLVELQREVLVPLELRMASSPGTATLRPAQLAETVDAALAAHRRRSRRAARLPTEVGRERRPA